MEWRNNALEKLAATRASQKFNLKFGIYKRQLKLQLSLQLLDLHELDCIVESVCTG